MRIIDKQRNKQEQAEFTQLDDAVKQAIFRCYVSQTASGSDKRVVQATLSEARAADAWLECDCRPALSAFLFPRRLAQGGYTIVRPSHDSDYYHTPQCPFHTLESQKELVDDTPDFNVLKREPTNNDGVNDKLLQILTWLLKQGGACLSYSPNNRYHYVHLLSLIRDQIQTWEPEAGAPQFKELLLTHDRYLVPFFKTLAKHDFPNDMRPQGFLLGLATEVNESAVTLVSGKTIDIGGLVYNPTKETGVSWVVVLFAESRPGFFTPFRIASWPVYSQAIPVVVSSDTERQVFKQIVSVCLKAKEHSASIVCHKFLSANAAPLKGFTVSSDSAMVKVTHKAPSSKKAGNKHIAYELQSTDREFRETLINMLLGEK